MTDSYLFSSTGMLAFARYVRADTLFVFNLDSILDQDDAARSGGRIPEQIKNTLQRLMNVAKVAVFSCRLREDALAFLGFEPHFLSGSHDLILQAQEKSRNWLNVKCCLKWREQLYDMLCHIEGVEVELLGESIAIHYRNSTNSENVLALVKAAIAELAPLPRSIDGEHVIHLLPGNALTKGETLMAALEVLEASKAVYFGSIETDEEVFQLNHAKIFGIHIGRISQTTACCYLLNLPEFLGLLNSMVGILETH